MKRLKAKYICGDCGIEFEPYYDYETKEVATKICPNCAMSRFEGAIDDRERQD